MQDDQYKENIKEVLGNLNKVNQIIFQSLIDISVQGELKQWSDSVPIGEVHQFSLELFENSYDINIQLLVQLMENVDEAFETIKNLNSIELDGNENNPEDLLF